MTTLDESEEFTRFEIDGWNRKAKPYANMLGRVTTRWIPAVLEAAGVEAGSDVLDLATGPGQVAAEAAAAGATVVGVDLATSMVALAKELHPNIDFRVGDAQNLEFPDASFDAVTMSFGLAHVPNQARVFAETYRVLRSGGRAVFCTWADQGGIGDRLVLSAVKTLGSLDVPLPFGSSVKKFGEPQEMQSRLSQEGFVETNAVVILQDWNLADADDLYLAFAEGSVRMAAILNAQDQDVQTKIRERLRSDIQAYASNGGFVVPMAAVVGSGKKP